MKTREARWYDLFERRGTRRDFLRVGGSVAGLVALGAMPSCGRERTVRFASDPFALGIGSGDPTPDGVVLWARLARRALEAAGVGNEAVAVRWEVADDEAFARLVQSGTASARPELGHSVHVEVDGLEAGRNYFYRLIAGDDASATARTRTAPAAGAPLDRLRFGVASCQHYEHGLFTAYRHLAQEDVDFVLHLGDYIYEQEPLEDGVRRHEGPEITTLDAYRGRYTTYRMDADLQAAHHAAPWIVTWDDHEVDNNYAGDAAEDDQSPEQLLLRRAAAYQAYYEFMPLRRGSVPAGPDMQLYRRLAFGDLVDMSVLDTRQYRSDQPCGDRNQLSCPAHMSPDQTILGQNQRTWLLDGLSASRARWNVLAQQVLVARLRRVREGGETWSMDMWDGYPLERTAILDAIAGMRTSNPVVLTGDIHSNWVADLKRDFDDPDSQTVATEFAGTSITSGGDGQAMSPGGQRVLDDNPHLKFYNGQRGFVMATVTPERWTSEFKIVPFVERPGAGLETAATFVVENGVAGAERA